MGTTFLANTYQTANTAPNLLFELVAAGVLTSVFVPTFVAYAVQGRREEGWSAANAMTSVALVGLTGLALLLMLGAPLVMKLLTLGVEDAGLRAREVQVGTDLLRMFSPQVIFYGAGMIMTAALHAHRRFVLPAAAPIFNNIIVIAVYAGYAVLRGSQPPSVQGTSAAEVWLLGAGTTMGVVAMTLVLWPAVARLGWRMRFSLDWSHEAVRKASRLGLWALGYAGGYQAGLIVVLLLANKIEGGVAAYQWAYTFFYVPHALFSVPIFSALFTAMSEDAAAGDFGLLRSRLRGGLTMLAFVLLPVAAALVALSEPLAVSSLSFGVMTPEGARLVGNVLACFAVGLLPYSIFLVLTRACYAIGETKLPTFVNALAVAVSSGVGAILFFELGRGWEVAGLALGHSIGFAAGSIALILLFGRRVGALEWRQSAASLLRSLMGSLLALSAMVLVVRGLAGRYESPAQLALGAAAGTLAYVTFMALARSPELDRLVRLVRLRT